MSLAQDHLKPPNHQVSSLLYIYESRQSYVKAPKHLRFSSLLCFCESGTAQAFLFSLLSFSRVEIFPDLYDLSVAYAILVAIPPHMCCLRTLLQFSMPPTQLIQHFHLLQETGTNPVMPPKQLTRDFHRDILLFTLGNWCTSCHATKATYATSQRNLPVAIQHKYFIKFFDFISLSLSIVHRSRQFFLTASGVRTELMYVSPSCWAYTGVSMCGGSIREHHLTVIFSLSIIWISDIGNEIKWDFFQTESVSILQYGCTTWTLTKRMKKKLNRNYTRMLF